MMPCCPSTPLRVTVMVSGVELCLRHHLQGNHYRFFVSGLLRHGGYVLIMSHLLQAQCLFTHAEGHLIFHNCQNTHPFG